jgi:hypothetical protein
MATKFNTVVSSSASNSQITTEGDLALITKRYADANYSGGGGSTDPNIIQVTSTDTTTDINRTTAFTVPFNSLDFNTNTSAFSFSTTNNQITVLRTGYYFVSASISYNDNGQTTPARANPSVRIYKNGSTSLNYTGAHGYLRNATGHDEASNSISFMVSLTANDTLEVKTLALTTATDPCLLTSGESVFFVAEMGSQYTPTGITASSSTSTTADVDVSQVGGTYYTALRTSGTITVASTPAPVVGGFAHLRISYGSEPTPSGTNIVKMAGADFVASTEMKMVFYNDGFKTYYYFLEI